MRQRRRRFSREFKLEAVRLAEERGRRPGEVARELGIRTDLLRKWRRQLLESPGAGPGNGQLTSADEELRRLKRELEVVRQERDFLKKAAA